MIETKISLDYEGVLELGRAGEEEARCFIFDLTDWMEHFAEGGKVSLLARRSWEQVSYPCTIATDGNMAVWTVRSGDVAVPGKNGRVELRYEVGGSVVLSKVWPTEVGESLVDSSGPAPDPAQPWVDEVLQAADRAESAAGHPPIPGADGFWHVWDPEGSSYIPTDSPLPPAKDGKDGHTPVKGEDYWMDADKAEIVDEVLDTLPDEVVSISSSAPSLQMAANKEYVCSSNVTSLTVTGFAASADGKPVEYSIMFRAGDSITVTLPDTVMWANGEPTFSANKGYYLAFIPMFDNYLGVYAEVE